MQPAMEGGSTFVAWIGGPLEDNLGERFERQVGSDNCVRFAGMKLQIPADRPAATTSRPRWQYCAGLTETLAIFQGQRKLRLRRSAAAARGGEIGQCICYRTGQVNLLPVGLRTCMCQMPSHGDCLPVKRSLPRTAVTSEHDKRQFPEVEDGLAFVASRRGGRWRG